MELRVLRYFLAVAREGSITSAAQALHITQPTLSKQLMDLEAELGKTLFLRGKRQITLTEDGLLLKQRAEEILALVDKTEKELAEDVADIAGDIHVGGGESIATEFLAEAANRLRREHPGVRFHLFSSNTEAVTERLDKGLLDFALMIGDVDAKKYDHITFPTYDSWGILMRKDNPLAAKESIRLEDLKEAPMIYSRHSMIRELLTSTLGRELDDPKVLGSYDLIHNAAIFVKHGMGCVLTFDNLLTITEDSPLTMRPLDPQITVPLHLAWKKQQIFTRAAQLYLETVQQVINEYLEDQSE